MTVGSELDPIVQAFLAEGSASMPDRVIDVVAARIAQQRQRSAVRFLNRPRTSLVNVAVGLAAALVVLVAAWSLLGRAPTVGEPSPTPVASSTGPSPSVAAVASDIPTGGLVHSGTFSVPLRLQLPSGWQARDPSFSLLQLTRADLSGGINLSLGIGIPRGNAYCSPGQSGQSGQSGADSAPAIATWLQGNPTFAVSNVHATTVDGQAATQLDVELAPTWTGTCLTSQGKPAAPLLSDPIGLYGQMLAGERARLTLVDAPGGRAMLIYLSAFDPTFFAAFADQAQPIVESIRFGP